MKLCITSIFIPTGRACLSACASADEARIALAGGADVIDVKEPRRGSLGAADAEVVADVVEVVGGRVPVSMARAASSWSTDD